MTAQGCSKCGSDRLKAAPIVLVDSVLNLVGSRRRYKCAACGWRGRRHRLKRRNSELPSLRPGTKARSNEVWFSLFVAAFLLVTGGLLMRSCNEASRAPVEGGDSQ